MSKVSSANYPPYTSSSISLGGSNATTGVVNGILTSDYDMSENESNIYNYALSTIASILPNINTFDANTLSSLKSEVDAYKNSGISEINELYNKSLSNLQNDSVSRFGNLDNSIFSEGLNGLESERADAVSAFAQNVLSKQSELKANELTQRYALIELLNGLANNTYNNALNAISTALSGSTSATNYNSDLYKAISNMASTNSKDTNSLLSNLLGSGNSTYTSVLASIFGK